MKHHLIMFLIAGAAMATMNICTFLFGHFVLVPLLEKLVEK